MDARDETILREFKRRLPGEILERLRGLLFFGSRSRGEGDEWSDLDLAALVDKKTPELERALDDISYSVMWDFDFKPVISLKVFEEGKFREAAERGFSFYKNVLREGIPV